MKFSIYRISLLLAVFAFAILPSLVFAGGLWDAVSSDQGLGKVAPIFGASQGEAKDIRNIVVDLIKVALSFLALVFVILMLTAGFKWMTSQGNASKVEEARNQIVRAAIGLIVVLAAYGLTLFIVKTVILITTGET
jgi:hypothetical protein